MDEEQAEQDPDGSSGASAEIAHYQIYEDILQGTRPIDWTIWALGIHDMTNLSNDGREAALWAVNVLREEFGDKFLADALANQLSNPPVEMWDVADVHPVFSQAFWPTVNQAPWVIANLLQLAAQMRLCRTRDRYMRTKRAMKDYRDVVKWIHGLLQFETAGLGLRAGWHVSFEPSLGNNRHADVCLESPERTTHLLVETSTMRMSDRELAALQSARGISGRLMADIQDSSFFHGVNVSGTIKASISEQQATEWLAIVTTAMDEVQRDGTAREVIGPTEGLIRISQGEIDSEGLAVETPLDPARPFDRLRAKIAEKAEQARGSTQPVWVRLEEVAGIWPALSYDRPSLADKLGYIAPHIQSLIEPHKELRGVILAPSILWAGGADEEELHQRFMTLDRRGFAVRTGLPGNRARETIIVARADLSEGSAETIARWYADEAVWLDWALTALHLPPFNALFQTP